MHQFRLQFFGTWIIRIGLEVEWDLIGALRLQIICSSSFVVWNDSHIFSIPKLFYEILKIDKEIITLVRKQRMRSSWRLLSEDNFNWIVIWLKNRIRTNYIHCSVSLTLAFETWRPFSFFLCFFKLQLTQNTFKIDNWLIWNQLILLQDKVIVQQWIHFDFRKDKLQNWIDLQHHWNYHRL